MARRIHWSPELRQYLETALWAETDNTDDSGGDPLDKNYGVEDFTEEAVDEADEELQVFLQRVDEAVQVEEDHEEETQTFEDRDFEAGDLAHDFWLTRNGHGTGFWDKPEMYGARLARTFSGIAKSFGEKHVYVNDDGTLGIE